MAYGFWIILIRHFSYFEEHIISVIELNFILHIIINSYLIKFKFNVIMIYNIDVLTIF